MYNTMTTRLRYMPSNSIETVDIDIETGTGNLDANLLEENDANDHAHYHGLDYKQKLYIIILGGLIGLSIGGALVITVF